MAPPAEVCGGVTPSGRSRNVLLREVSHAEGLVASASIWTNSTTVIKPHGYYFSRKRDTSLVPNFLQILVSDENLPPSAP